MIRSIRGPLGALLAIALAIAILSRIASMYWLQHAIDATAIREVVPILWFNFAVELAVLLAVFLALYWLIKRDRRDRSEKARLDHLAEVAAMSGGFAHEARNLLHAMQARIDLLRKSVGVDEKSNERLNKLEELAGGMEQLFTDFLAFNRPADDQLEETDVTGLVKQVLEFEELELERAGISVRCDFAAAIPPALVDRRKLKRALLNLVVNARHSMPDGGELVVRVIPQGKRVRIEVTDTGCGIPWDDQRHIFETYFTTKSEGTGLGLAITQRTIEDFGGQIAFTSVPEQGTTFVVTLPSVEQHRANLKRVLKELALQNAAR